MKIKDQQIDVQCVIEVNCQYYSFVLVENLKIKCLKNNGKDIKISSTECYELQFLPKLRKYQLKNLETGILSFQYTGVLTGDFLFMQEELYHFSYYNGWYPIGINSEEDYEITIKVKDDYEFINSILHNERREWQYLTHNQSIKDCNIMLIHKDHSFHYQNQNIDLYYFDSQYQSYMYEFFHQYSSIYEYYIQLYGHDKIHHTTIVFLPNQYHLGAYKRDYLVVFSEIGDDIENEMHRLAHEIAHAYACGANLQTWEDWLNETHAEWSALLYELENRPVLFEQSIQRKLAEPHSNCLRLDGEQRPDDVHTTGTLLYYEIYQMYGIESIKLLLRTFDQLENKNTNHFLTALSLEDKVLADFIQSRL